VDILIIPSLLVKLFLKDEIDFNKYFFFTYFLKVSYMLPHYTIVAGIVWKQGRILIDQRRQDSMLGGLWEFPGGKRKRNETLKTAVEREVFEELGVRVKPIKPYMKVQHAYSHFRITLHVFVCEYISGQPKTLGCAAFQWIIDINETIIPFKPHIFIHSVPGLVEIRYICKPLAKYDMADQWKNFP
jgi:mutator protein MutT